MTDYPLVFINVLEERGFVHSVSDRAGIVDACEASPITAYIGFDCTKPSLHVGSLVQIMMLYWLQRCGHRPIIVLGSGTTRIGDPSGRDTERPILGADEIEVNKAGIRKAFRRILIFGDNGPIENGAIEVDNADWLLPLNHLDFLREVGKHFSVNRMLTMDAVKSRLEAERELSFLAFNYLVLQSFDFVELSRRYGCVLQMGGSDQWGNIVNGIELGRKMTGAKLFGLTSPLLETSAGQKMGKTADGAVWLDAEKTSPYEFWQFWRNTDDADVERFLLLFTALPVDMVRELRSVGINVAKERLATEVTRMVHGAAAADAAAATAHGAFESDGAVDGLPSTTVDGVEFDGGIGVLSAFVRAGLVSSTSEARRKIKEGGLYVNGETVTDERATITRGDLRDGAVRLSFGRKKHAVLREQVK